MKPLIRSSESSQRAADLVRECLDGNEDAWSLLIDQYKSLIFSIPIKYGFHAEEAEEIFQDVCLSLLMDLPKIREPQALTAWLIQATSHKCFHLKRQRQRYVAMDGQAQPSADPTADNAEDILRECEREQIVREALSELPARCQELVRLRFFAESAVPYEQIAKILGVATGSIGFLRMRCLDGLRRLLKKKGFR
jgi:RNA polymerase sigma factor (sigma-70 family)